MFSVLGSREWLKNSLTFIFPVPVSVAYKSFSPLMPFDDGTLRGVEDFDLREKHDPTAVKRYPLKSYRAQFQTTGQRIEAR